MGSRVRFYLLMCVVAASSAFGGTSAISYVYQPLTTVGTDAEPKMIIAKVPIILSGSPESVLVYVGAPVRLLQRGPAIVEDSNLLSPGHIGRRREVWTRSLHSDAR